MRYPKLCECGLKVAHLDKHRHGITHKNRIKMIRWYRLIFEEHFTINQYQFSNTQKVLNEMKQYLGIKD